MDLYLTSPDWTFFAESRQIQSIDRIEKGLFSYFLVTLMAPITYGEANHPQVLLTSTFHFVRPDFQSRLPLQYDVYTVKRDKHNKITCGEMLGKGVDLHTRDQ